LDDAFGPAKVAINTVSATAKVDATPWSTFAATVKILRNVVGARLSGRYRENPFFKPGTAEPFVTPQVLTATERAALRGEA
jgi:hypothetical protein